jgi:hypothetical protein
MMIFFNIRGDKYQSVLTLSGMGNGIFTVRNLIVGSVFFTAILVYWLGALLRDSRMSEVRPPVSLGSKETCLNCHSDMTGFAAVHDPATIGCASCHLGNPTAVEEKKAHKGMVLIPGNLSNVYQTCGTANCHLDIAKRVGHSLMTTMAGVITVDRFVFGEIDTLAAFAHVRDLGHSPADKHLRHLCASCHLGNEKQHPGPISERSRGGGCLACHLNPPLSNQQSPAKAPSPFTLHPSLTLKVTNDHCFGCHSRSGRISMGFEGWHETLLTPDQVQGQSAYRVLADGRVLQMITPDVHHTRGMDCIDCHSANETMGDGVTYLHEEDAVKVKCQDCHFSGPPKTVGWEGLDEETKKILGLRKLPYQGHDFLVGQSGEVLWNGWVDPVGKAFLVSKNTGVKRPLNPPAEVCTRGAAHDNLTCGACHTAWAPQCIGCHTAYNPDIQAFDLLDKKRTQGKWEEYLGGFFADPPVLGVVEKMEMGEERIRQIRTFIPGMVMTLDQSDFPQKKKKGETFHRLYAPVAPHTTSAEGRSCASCHLDPLAMGYGRGKLEYRNVNGKGKWFFTPEYVGAPQDGLPQDAWIPFLKEPRGLSTTRPNARPFNLAEQHRILRAGACLSCHDGNSKVMLRAVEDFDGALKGVSGKCLLPSF